MRFLKSKWLWGFIIVLVVARALAPAIILKQMNKVLAEFSESYTGHIKDVDISLIRGAYQLEDFELRLKKGSKTRFVHAELVDVSIAWRELFRGKILSDITANQLYVRLNDEVLNAFKANSKKEEADSKEAASKLFPLHLERFDLKNSKLEFAELIGIPDAPRWIVTNINGRASNVTATESSPITLANLRGTVFGKSTLQAVAQVNQLQNPVAYDVDVQLKDFNLPEANQWLKGKVPLTITKGKLDLYAEVMSEKGNLVGYAKPFVHKADIIADNEKFKGFKHFAIELGTAAANLLFRDAKERTLATKIQFSYENGNFHLNSAKALSEAFKNGFSEKIPEGLDDEISLSKSGSTALKAGEKL